MKRLARKEKEKQKRERHRERERKRRERERKRQEAENRRQKVIKEVGIEDLTLVGDDAHALVKPTEYRFVRHPSLNFLAPWTCRSNMIVA